MKIIIKLSIVAFLFIALCACNSTPTSLPVDDAQRAQKTLLDFLDNLHNGDYEKAVQLYGGSYETMQNQNPDLDANGYTALMRRECTENGTQCLQVKSAVLDKKNSETEFVFKVEFQRDDGTTLTIGPCCGANETEDPPRFEFYLKVQKTEKGEFKVMDMPPYQP